MKTHLFFCGMVIALLLSRSLAAQSAPGDLQGTVSPLGPCDRLLSDRAHSDALRKVCLYAVTIPEQMPNFSCEQKTYRYVDGKPADVVSGIVTYEDGRESFQEIKSNGHPVTDAMFLNSGTWSTGQFGGDIHNLFAMNNQVRFQFAGEGKVDGHRALIFQYWVAHQDSPSWRLHAQDKNFNPPYHGQLWIDEDTGNLLRLQLIATELPRVFALRRADLQIDYGDVQFGDGTSLVLPFKSEVNSSDRDGGQDRNVLKFRNCHKFRATARVVPE